MKSLNLFRCFDSTSKWLASIFTGLILTACGGGGLDTPSPLYVAAPGTVTLAVGATSNYGISGGKLPYTVSSSNASVVSASGTATTLTLTGVASGTAQVVVFDAAGLSATVNATVGSGSATVTTTPFFATAPSTIKLAIGEAASFNLSGGTAPYFQSSSQAAVTTGTIDAGKLTITGRSAGAADMSVFDSAGSTLKISVNVGALTSTDLYMTAPSTISLEPAAASSFIIGGGSAPYTVSSSNTAVATAAIIGNSTLAISAKKAGTAQIVVFDITGKSVATTLTVAPTGVISPPPLYVAAPGTVTLAVGATSNYGISGGTLPYTVSSSNASVVGASGTATTLTLTGVASGTAQVVVFDAAGLSATVNATVGSGSATVTTTPFFATAPSTIKLAIGEAASFNLSGGTAPYFQSSSQAAVTTGIIDAGKLTITGRSAGAADMSVFDSAGNTLKISVNVGALTSTDLYMTAPSTISLEPAAASSFTIGGGSAPYTVSSSNTAVATAAIIGNSTLAISAKKAGTAQIVVFDSTGKSVATTLTVAPIDVSPPSPLYVAAPGTVTLAAGSTTPSYGISGGTLPYTVSSSNVGVVSASGTATTFVLTGVASGTAQVVVFDALGLSATVTVTVTSATSSLLSVLPGTSTATVGDVLSFALSGGSGSYSSVTVSNASIAAVSTSSGGTFSNSLGTLPGTAFFAKLLNQGTTTVAIVDSQGQSTTMTLTATARSSMISLSPSALQVGENSITPIALNIFGGTAPYSALTDDLQLSSVSITGTTALPTLTIDLGSKGSRCITPFDSAVVPRVYVASGIYNVTVTVVDSLGASATSVLSIRDNGAGELDACR